MSGGRSRSGWALVALLAVGLGARALAEGPGAAGVDRARLEAMVRRVAASDLGGRRTPAERERTAEWIADRMKEAGLLPPLGREGYLLPFKARAGTPAGRNVAGRVQGTKDDGIVLLVTHYDGHLREGPPSRPGADAHASGIAALLEAGRMLAAGPPLRRSVLVVALDLAQVELAGARALLAEPPVDLATVAAVVAVERVGRSLGDAFPGTTFVHGAETAEAFGPVIAGLSAPSGGAVRSLGSDLVSGATNDALAFEEQRLPSLLLTGGRSRDDDGAGDVVEKLDLAGLAARTEVLAALVRALADAPARPVWRDPPPPTLEEVRTLRAVVGEVGGREAELQAPPEWRALRADVERLLDAILARGAVTVGERASLRVLLLQVLGNLTAPR